MRSSLHTVMLVTSAPRGLTRSGSESTYSGHFLRTYNPIAGRRVAGRGPPRDRFGGYEAEGPVLHEIGPYMVVYVLRRIMRRERLPDV
ncbi:hypothetical protein GCM10009733_089360 [Nonomuraea maheshkhaliensis]|uniref:Uncharacterized protein n=1 Tax=Nonomuraea maheshkhaliensis TaxID=419590 RepID=A0ABP4SX10_9ACTN